MSRNSPYTYDSPFRHIKKLPGERYDTGPKKRALLAVYSRAGTLRKACEGAQTDSRTHARWLQEDPEYAKAFIMAHEMFADSLEHEAIRRAVEGTRRMKFFKGRPIIDPTTNQPYIEHEYSDNLLMFTLKRFRPEYRENPAAQDMANLHGRQISASEAIKLLHEFNERRTLPHHAVHVPSQTVDKDILTIPPEP